jgi:hypothetical protein
MGNPDTGDLGAGIQLDSLQTSRIRPGFSHMAITRLRWIAAGVVLIAGLVIYWLGATPSGRTLRQFDPDRMADLELRMWQAYYAKERVRLFALSVTMLHEQNHYSWVAATRQGLHLARAAATVGDARANYESVLLDLENADDIARDWLHAGFDPRAVARAELAWWVARRTPGQDSPERIGRLMAEVYARLYEVSHASRSRQLPSSGHEQRRYEYRSRGTELGGGRPPAAGILSRPSFGTCKRRRGIKIRADTGYGYCVRDWRNGYIGRALIDALCKHGYGIHALVRRGSEGRLPRGALPIIGDALDTSTLASGILRGTTLVHLVGTPHPSPAKAAEFRRVDLTSIKATTAAAQRAGGRHLIYVSVAHPAPVMRVYITAREEGERIVQASGIPATILRPWYILGPGHRWPYLLVPVYAVLRWFAATREVRSDLAS